ncbi:SNARE associated Golgi protein [Desulfotomaculum nigrificans CO-1-SRB]|uniref:TVP38/TMEM64 family membrane protein n=1 Tax=Desulfotomaculum nigrificans (strain DSM 14880 / VKM B-2319 / CO-1-SRB) TaxID=868595 RepID=F6B9V4_DESCC|nr:TVP38/TMEM64 family protein [Desulfotomaculum nigrificans]AEF93802.1 SNARE associated Golgi protein [Desulfotomaculum nigrificans CO-1-SRB]
MNKKTWIKIGIFVLLAALYFGVEPLQTAIKRVVFIISMVDITAMKSYILSFGIWAPVVSFFLMVFQSLAAPLPAFVITFANAALFGWVKGAILSWSSAMAGAALCFWIANFYGRSVVERLVSAYALKKIDRFFARYGKYAILMARLLPFVSFDAVSYAAGLTSIGFWEFFWATGLGQLPATLIYSYVGGLLVGGTKMFVFGVLSVISLTILAFIIKKVLQDKDEDLTNMEVGGGK